MGKPLVIGERSQRYARIEDKPAFDAHYDEIEWRSKSVPPGAGKTTILYRNGERIVLVDQGKCVRPDIHLTPNHLKSGISVYDVIMQPGGPNSEPTKLIDITAAAKAGGHAMPTGPSADAL